MIRWEYNHITFIDYRKPEEVVEALDAYGEEGWEVVSVEWADGEIFAVFLKRMKEQG
jgi:hypothetical protein